MNVEKLNKIHNLEAENLALPLQEVLKNSNISDLTSLTAFEQHNDELSTRATSLEAVPPVLAQATEKAIEDHKQSQKDNQQSTDKNVLFLEPAPELRKPVTSRKLHEDKVFSRRLVLEVPPMREDPRRRQPYNPEFHDSEFYHSRDGRRQVPPQNQRNYYEQERRYPTRFSRSFEHEDRYVDYIDFDRYEDFGNPFKSDPAYYSGYTDKPYRPGYSERSWHSDMNPDHYGYDPYRYESSYGYENQPIRNSHRQASADVHIVNLPLHMNRQDVFRMCMSFGDITYMHMPSDPSGMGRKLGMAFVSFDSMDAAKQAVRQLDGSVLGRNQIHVSVVQK